MESGRQRNPRDYYYGEVLQLPPGTKQPDHYVLLGVRYFEEDHDTILRAALDRIRLLETCEADPRPAYRKVLAQLIAEVREAQMTLLDPRRRRVYEAALTGTQEVEPEEDSRELELSPGTMFADRYRILREIRRGALGVVYEAGDKNLRSKVHVSILRPRLSHERIPHRRIEQAARAAHALDHPGILRLDEVGTGDGLLFVRTRAIERRGLLEVIEATDEMRLGTGLARRILMGVADALRYAHAQGIVHGDLRPHNVFVDDEGHTLVADFCLSRAVADALHDRSSLYREPENDPAPAADLFALGCIAYQMLAGMPPFPAGATDPTPKPLPDDVPADLASLVMGLLARDPAARPALDDVIAELRRERRSKRLPLYVAAGAVLVAGLVAGGLAFVSGDTEEKTPVTLEAAAWRLVANRKFDEAIRRLREARKADPADASLAAPLAQALEGAAEVREKAGDPCGAQVLLKEAAQLEPSPRRAEALERVTAEAIRRLHAIRVEIAEVTAEPAVFVDVRELRSCVVAGKEMVASGPRMALPDLAEGRRELDFVMIDRAGNRRAGVVVCVVDRTAPVITIAEPPEGAQFRKGRVPFRVQVDDANPAETLSVNGRAASLGDGEALGVLELEDGEHRIEVVARDRAGNQARATRTIVVDSRAPELELATARIATRDGRVSVRGRVHSRAERVTVDGRPVDVDEDGAFAVDVEVTGDRVIPVVAVGVTGLRRELAVEVLFDDEPPRVAVLWERRDKRGTLLYGTKEMDAATLALPLRADDKTRVTFLPEQGRVENGIWHVPAQEGHASVRLRARDEAGNESDLRVDVEGHRAAPRLKVKCSTDEEITNDRETQLEIEADRAVLVQGEPREPGRIKMPLPEGKVELVVRVVDPYGNETRWTSKFTVDRTPPKIELEGGPERGIGRQELLFVADEELRSVTCFGKTVRASGRSARVETTLRPGRRRLYVVAKDLAGNSSKATFSLEVKNRVLLLDGRSAVQVALPATVNLDTFTVECWVRGLTPEGSRSLVSNYDHAGFALQWSSSKVRLPTALLYAEKSGMVPLQAKKPWAWDSWAHLALSHDGKRVRFYVNGSLQLSVELKERMKPSRSPLYIGRAPTGQYTYFTGAIDEVRVSNVARYTRGFSPPRFHKEDDKTVLLLRFDTLRGKLFPDSSDHGHHGIPLGNPRLKEESR